METESIERVIESIETGLPYDIVDVVDPTRNATRYPE
jgi:hypothetical protein